MSAGMAAGWSADMAAAVLGRLRVLEEFAAGRGRVPDVARLREELVGMLVAWRRLLVAHAADESGRCPRCRGWVRRRRWPCRVWTTAHHSLITSSGAVECAAPEGAPAPGSMQEVGARPGRGASSAPNSSAPGRGLLVIPRRAGGAR